MGKTRVVKVRLPEELYIELIRRYGVRGISRGITQIILERLGPNGSAEPSPPAAPPAPRNQRKKVVCPRCGYEWETRSTIV
jgi:hypothetical protein